MRSRTRQALHDLKRDPFALARLMGWNTPMPDEQDAQCLCAEPSDDDNGNCLECGKWINYRERSAP